MDTQTQAQNEAQEMARQAAAAAAKVESTGAYKTAYKVINTDLKNAAGTAEGIFAVIQQCQNWQEADSTFRLAENNLIAHYRKTDASIKTMQDLCRMSGVSQLSYSQIKNVLINAVKESDALVLNLQKLYDFQYEGKSNEDKAKDGHETVPEGFLNPWHSRYTKRVDDDEKPVTTFQRDRRLAQGALKALDSAQKLQTKERLAAEKRATERHAEALRAATATADTAVAGSGQTPQGMAGATVGRVQAPGRTLSVVLQREYGLFTNALYSASDELPDAVVIPIISQCTDALVALVAAAKEATRRQAAEHGTRPVAVGISEPGEQEMQDGDVQITAADLPDVPEDPGSDTALTDTDKALIEEFGQQESGNAVVHGE